MRDWHYWGLVSNLWFIGAYLNQSLFGSLIMLLMGLIMGLATITDLIFDSKISRLDRERQLLFERIVINNLVEIAKHGSKKRKRN